jgi:menaquinone-dependent protoporphyrinogen oxidase
MTVLVAAASKHGATEEIAERIGAVLAAHGVEVDVKKLQEVSGLAGYEAFVLGSGIYLGKWLKEARRVTDQPAESAPA